jgi:hypothetical protein
LAQDGGEVDGVVGVFGSVDGRQHVAEASQAEVAKNLCLLAFVW